VARVSTPLHPRNLAALGYDIVAAAAAWGLAFLFRFNFDIPDWFGRGMAWTGALAVLVQAICFVTFGLYRGIWRYASIHDLQRIVLAVSLSAVLVPGVLLIAEGRTLVPRVVLLLDPILLVLMMAGARFAYRAWKERRLYGQSLLAGEPVAVVGAGEAGAALVGELRRSKRYRVVALFDDSANRIGRLIHGVPVVGGIEALTDWARRAEVARVIIALPSAAASARRRAVEAAQAAELEVLTVPAFEDIASGQVGISQLRHVELEDLLGRDPVVLEAERIEALIARRVVLVTGAGGSIGSELCRQVARHSPSRLLLVEANEFALYQILEEFRTRWPALEVHALIADVKDEARIERLFSQYTPDIVLHAAAFKHVPLMEEENAWQAVRNNVLGSAVVAAAASRHGVAEFVLISTDKAVNPTNVMGATKRLAERVCRSWEGVPAATGMRTCKFITVRFGNVLGSAGSVIPKFRAQIAAGGPVTVTHPEIQRYFMSIPEAAQLVLQAGLMGEGGEIFVLDMGEPVRIVDLARDMIRLSGFAVEDIGVEFTGLRPGEKLYEELLADDELTVRTRHPRIRIARTTEGDLPAWRETLLAEIAQAGQPGDEEARAWIASRVPEYRRPGQS
jgi:FlaA1/EpsC-like NDP-sugar epimerase